MSQTGRHIPEANVRKLRFWYDHFEAWPILDCLHEELGIFKHFVDVLLQAGRSFRLPHEPKLQHVHSSTALNVFIAYKQTFYLIISCLCGILFYLF